MPAQVLYHPQPCSTLVGIATNNYLVFSGEWSQVTTNNTLGFSAAEELRSWTLLAWATGTSCFILVVFSTPPAGFLSNVNSVNSDAISARLSKFLGLTNSFWLPPPALLSPPRTRNYLPRRHCTGAYSYHTSVNFLSSMGYQKVVATYCGDITGPATSLFPVQIGPRRPVTQTGRELGGYGTGTSIYSGIPTAGTSSTDDRIANSSQATNTWKIRAQGRTIRTT